MLKYDDAVYERMKYKTNKPKIKKIQTEKSNLKSTVLQARTQLRLDTENHLSIAIRTLCSLRTV